MRIEDLTVVVCCNKDDYYFARICIASVRYFYPDIAIELVKDTGKGDFDTNETEKHFGVLNVDLGVKKWDGLLLNFFICINFQKAKDC